MSWKKLNDDKDFVLIVDEDVDEGNNSDEEEDSIEEVNTDELDESDYEQNKQIINYSRTIVETISKMIQRLKQEEEFELKNESIKQAHA